jgi:hypothetical protein
MIRSLLTQGMNGDDHSFHFTAIFTLPYHSSLLSNTHVKITVEVRQVKQNHKNKPGNNFNRTSASSLGTDPIMQQLCPPQ